MQNLYYVVEKELQQIDLEIGTEETTGWKIITVYDIDTQATHIIEVFQIKIKNKKNSEKQILKHLEKIAGVKVDWELIEL